MHTSLLLKRAYIKVYFIIAIIITTCNSLCGYAQDINAAEFMQSLGQARKLSSEKKWMEAIPYWVKLTEQNPVNGEYWANLATAFYNSKEHTKAIDAYKKQIDLGYGRLEIAAYNVACCYALTRDKDQALTWLQKSFDMGFHPYETAQQDEDLKSLHNDPRFARIVSSADVSKMTRTEGWQYDLQLLKREILRKAYKGSTHLQMDTVLQMLNNLSSRISKLNDTQITLEMMKLMAKIGDGHSGILPPIHKDDFKYSLPLQFYVFKEGLYIISADKKYKDLLGSQVIKFGGNDLATIYKSIEPLINRDNAMWIPQLIPYMLRYIATLNAMGLTPDARQVQLTLKDINGITKSVIVSADTTQPNIWNTLPNPSSWINLPQTLSTSLPLYLKNMNQKYWFENLTDKQTVYCQINSIRNDPRESLTKFTERLFQYLNDNNVSKLVIDLRWNNGGNTNLAMPLINAVIRNEKINKRGNLFVIIGRRTFSAAQNTATYLERFTNAIFIGEPTGSSPNFVGEEDFLVLPYSKIMANVSDLFWQSSWPGDKRTWIAPLIYTPPTFKAYSTNNDVALDAIWSF